MAMPLINIAKAIDAVDNNVVASNEMSDSAVIVNPTFPHTNNITVDKTSLRT